MNTTYSGRAAEERVAQEILKLGYKVLSRNWHTRLCEIDIIAKNGGVVYLIEVKYRVVEDFGGGLSAITPQKIKKLRLGAAIWAAENRWQGDMRLVAASVSPDGLIEFVNLDNET